MNETLTQILIIAPCLIIAIVFHEVAHGLAALKLGDTTARDLNRLSLNPLRHVDLVGTLLVPGALALAGGPPFGWAKPVPVRKDRLNNPRFGMMAVAAAGPASNFVMALFGAVGLGLAAMIAGPVSGDEPTLFVQAIGFFILINVFLGVFNLLPIPPFDGSHILEGVLPPSLAQHYARLRPFGMMLFMGLVMLTWFAPELGVLENTIGKPATWVMEQYFGIAGAIAG